MEKIEGKTELSCTPKLPQCGRLPLCSGASWLRNQNVKFPCRGQDLLATEDNLVQVTREEGTPYLQMHISQPSPALFVVLRKGRKMKIVLGPQSYCLCHWIGSLPSRVGWNMKFNACKWGPCSGFLPFNPRIPKVPVILKTQWPDLKCLQVTCYDRSFFLFPSNAINSSASFVSFSQCMPPLYLAQVAFFSYNFFIFFNSKR